MIMFKKWAKHKVKSYIYYVDQFFSKKHYKKWIQNVNKTVTFVQFM